jgi:predicted ATPase
MRIDWLRIENWKNLRGFEIDFDESQLTTVLMGANATGKSNLMEAIVRIFRNLDLDEPPDFAYQIRYECRGKRVEIDANPRATAIDSKNSRVLQIRVDGKDLSRKNYSTQREQILPTHVFAYYSGTKQRLERLFDKHLEDFYGATLKSEPRSMRRLFYCHPVHSNYVLMAYFAKGDAAARKFLADTMGITGVESVLFVLRSPWWFSGQPTSIQEKEGDPRFWYARGLVRKFVSALWDHAYPPILDKGKDVLDFRGRSEDKEWLYLFVPDESALQKLAATYGSQKEFFKELESTWINDLILETRIKVCRSDTSTRVTFQDLSEGEQQLLTVLGLLRFTKDDECLFLLDEPDTHLNPQWKFDYLRTLEDVVGQQSKSQMLIATHDPLVVLSLSRQQVRLFERDPKSGLIKAEPPYQNPSDLSVNTLLTSEVYGLRASIAPQKLAALDRKRLLSAKERLTVREKKDLATLAEELGGVDATLVLRDPLYERFVEAMTVLGYDRGLLTPTLTRDQRKEQQKMAEEVLQSMRKG